MNFSKLCQTKHILERYHFCLESSNIPRLRDVIKEISTKDCQLWNKMMIPCFLEKSVQRKVETAIHNYKFLIKST